VYTPFEKKGRGYPEPSCVSRKKSRIKLVAENSAIKQASVLTKARYKYL